MCINKIEKLRNQDKTFLSPKIRFWNLLPRGIRNRKMLLHGDGVQHLQSHHQILPQASNPPLQYLHPAKTKHAIFHES